ncbi:MAG TPA: hypothetical protein DET40_01300 [Lentisphaeria bacterium]|nr:MAG: hypothetical protein A2X45_09445 [Lentisphaerae bacterium GWF2_50_93]HCE42168.1 hypothetical protein [Lentisphaeria bacterium]
MKTLSMIALISVLSFAVSQWSTASTITFKEKDGSTTTITNAEIVAIKDGSVVIEKDKKRRSFPLSSIATYSQTDATSGGTDKSLPGEFSDYKITIMDVKSPDKDRISGTSSKTSSASEKSAAVEIEYNLTRLNPEIKRIKAPYVYIYLLLPPSNDSGEREVVRYCFPDAAKPKGKGYDEAAIKEKVNGFDRRIIDEGEREQNLRTELKNMGSEKVKFDLKGIRGRRLIAYHIEVWGTDSIVAEKDWQDFDSNVSKKWWERY